MEPLGRRDLLKGSLGAAAVFAVPAGKRTIGANERVVAGVMGLGGRGTYLATSFAARSDAEIAYLCDVDSRRFARAQKGVCELQKREPKTVQDFRRILDDGSVDVLINATPDHWHGIGTIMACQAGKDVYVEKPLSHNLFEGRKMVEAARKYRRVVQVGMQSRSAAYIDEAADYVRSGKLGEVHLVRVFNMMKHAPMKRGAEQPVPEGFDYDMWCGPAAKLPYNPSRRWLNFWEYSCGPIPGDAVHQLDLARLLIGDEPYPKSVSHAGGIYVLKDGRNTPDTQLAMYEYDGLTLELEASLWTPYVKKIPQSIRNSDSLPDWPFSSTRIEVFGTQGFMYLGRHGGGWQAFDADGKLVRTRYGRQGDKEHQDNFIECIRTRRRPNADVEQGHYSALLCHLANTSYRCGNRRLVFDGRTESFPADPQAEKYLRRRYRKPWVVPETV